LAAPREELDVRPARRPAASSCKSLGP
jgi:hypothetical protein